MATSLPSFDEPMERKFGHNKECIQQNEYGSCCNNEKVIFIKPFFKLNDTLFSVLPYIPLSTYQAIIAAYFLSLDLDQTVVCPHLTIHLILFGSLLGVLKFINT